jgi:hypothetical protein
MKLRSLLISAAAAIAVGGVYATVAQGQAAFGTDEDVAYAAELWAALEDAHFVGHGVVHGTFHEGAEPHGFVLETLFADITVNGTTAPAIIKRNYGPVGVTVGEVDVAPNDHLAAITVMYQRTGFNAETNDWFWVKWLADGTLDFAGETQMAGNVGGCIGCHTNAPGDDWIFVTDRPMHAPMDAMMEDGGGM